MIEKSGVRLVLCADDFGISKGVDDAILELSSKGRLSAISCMTVASNWVEEGKRLVAIEANIGDKMDEEDTIIVLESMKMEIPVTAPQNGTLKEILVAEGDAVPEGQDIAIMEG